jgi:hypothetical protein
MPAEAGRYTLEVPLDASQIGEDAKAQELRVLARGRDGLLSSETVKVKPGHIAAVELSFKESPGPLQLLVGPASTSAAELENFQTLGVEVPGGRWSGKAKLTLDPLPLSLYYWEWWLRWCRRFTISGRLICANGDPVPGATVCAYDIDWWFWWTSRELLGCATTDGEGVFSLSFTRCCGLLPWWWWRERVWQIDPGLLARVGAVLERDPRLTLGRAANQPSLGVFNEILAPSGLDTQGTLKPSDTGRLEELRGALLSKLPDAPELEALHVWPWWPWWPWLDCSANVVFSATQVCGEGTGASVILDEGFAQARWDIPEALSVTLTANELACCATPPCREGPCPEGECVFVSDICNTPIDEVSGNVGAPAGPLPGLLNPGAVIPGSAAWAGDRPLAGTTEVQYGNVMTNVDYYEIEYRSVGGSPSSWSPLPLLATPLFVRRYMEGPVWTATNVPFAFANISGHAVVESREHFEARVGWNPLRQFWVSNVDLLAEINSTMLPGGDGTYWFRVVGWQIDASNNLYNRRVLPTCDTETENGWVLTFDNQAIATTPYPEGCGTGFVTGCVDEPVTRILDVLVNGKSVEACAVVEEVEGTLDVDFIVEAPAGWLGYYTLAITWGDSHEQILVPTPPGGTLTVTAGDCQGPTYGQALGQGCAAPVWRGGQMRLSIPLSEVFVGGPCCYQLQLEAWTRHVIGCSGEPYRNVSEFTVGWGVCAPKVEPLAEAVRAPIAVVDAER